MAVSSAQVSASEVVIAARRCRSWARTARGAKPVARCSPATTTGRPPDTASSVAMARSTTRGSAPVLSTSAQPRPPERGVGVARTHPGPALQPRLACDGPAGIGQGPGHRRRRGTLDVVLRRLVLDADEGPDRHPPGEVVQVGVEDRADRRLGREGLAERGEVEQQPPAPGAPAEEPGAPHGDPLLLGVTPGDDVPVVGDGCAGQDLLPGDRPADRGAHAHGQVRIERGRPAPRDRQRVERRELAEHGAEPAGPGIQQLGRPADAVGQRSGLRVDQAGRRAFPRRRATWSPARPSPAAPDRPASGPARPDRLGPAPPRSSARFSLPRSGGGEPVSTEVGGRSRAGRDGASGPASATAAAERAASHFAARSGRTVVGTLPSAHSSSSPSVCLHGTFRLGHEQRQAGPGRSTITSYGSADVPR